MLEEFVYDEVTGGFAGYSGRGRRTTMKYGSGLANTMKYFYDSRGRVARAEHTLGGTTYVRQTTYDALDRVLSITYPNNEVVAYFYGDHGAPVRLTSSRWGVIVESAAYNALLKPTSVALGNGLSAAYQYWGVEYRPVANPNGHFGLVRSVVAGSLQNLAYDYDSRGNVSQLVDTRVGETIAFAYDHLDRLTSAASGLFSESYGYTKIGTFTTKGGVAYTYPNAGQPRPHAPLTVGGLSYTYDNNGNLTGAESRNYTYDVLNRLTGLSGDVSKSFTYDADSVLRTNVAGGVTTRIVSGDYRVNASTGEAFVLYGFGGRQVAWADNASIKYLLADHLSSSHTEVSTSQSELGQRRNYPFGSDRAVSGASDLTVEERYTGQRRLDAGNGNSKRELYYYGARWYLPGVGIFSQADTLMPDIKNPQNLNLYSYVLNNPLRYVDPTGYQVEQWIGEQPEWFNEEWLAAFQNAHGRDPSAEDYAWRFVSMALTSGILESMATQLGIPGHERGVYSKPEQDIGQQELRTRMNLLFQIPAGVDFQRNLTFAEYMSNVQLSEAVFAGLVRPRIGPLPQGAWDFKDYVVRNRPIENFGNFNYGAAGTAWEFPERTLLQWAGLGKPDDPADQLMIMLGIAFYRTYSAVRPQVPVRAPSPLTFYP